MGWNHQLEIGRIPKSFLVFQPFIFQVANSLLLSGTGSMSKAPKSKKLASAYRHEHSWVARGYRIVSFPTMVEIYHDIKRNQEDDGFTLFLIVFFFFLGGGGGLGHQTGKKSSPFTQQPEMQLSVQNPPVTWTIRSVLQVPGSFMACEILPEIYLKSTLPETSPWKLMVRRLLSFWDAIFRECILSLI